MAEGKIMVAKFQIFDFPSPLSTPKDFKTTEVESQQGIANQFGHKYIPRPTNNFRKWEFFFK